VKDKKKSVKRIVHKPEYPVAPGQWSVSVPVDVTPEQMMMETIKQGGNVETLERLFNLRERLQKEKAEQAYRSALAKFQGECPIIPKGRRVPEKNDKSKTRYKFSAIEDIMKVVQPLLSKHDLLYKFDTLIIDEPSAVKVVAKVSHILGHYEESTFTARVQEDAFMTEPQKWASAMTFASRYAIRNALGIVVSGEDNDANQIEDEEKKKQFAEAEKMLKELPEYIQKGFKLLNYNESTSFQFCKDRKWDNEKIKAAIDKAVEGRKNVDF